MICHRHVFSILLALANASYFYSDGAAGVANEIHLPGHGRLVFNVPADWRMKVLDTPSDQPPLLEFDPGKSDAARMRVMVLWTKQPDSAYNQPEAIRKLIQMAGDSQLFTATEQQIDLKEIHGNAGTGYWYALTDRAPQAEDFQYMLHGAYPVGPLLLDFTVLSRSSLRNGDSDTLRIIGSTSLLPETK